jgi:hypothetical protein
VEKYNPSGVSILEIPFGDVFVYGGSYYIKVEGSNVISNEQLKHNVAAVDLATGTMVLVPDTEIVPPIYCRMRINGRAD